MKLYFTVLSVTRTCFRQVVSALPKSHCLLLLHCLVADWLGLHSILHWLGFTLQKLLKFDIYLMVTLQSQIVKYESSMAHMFRLSFAPIARFTGDYLWASLTEQIGQRHKTWAMGGQYSQSRWRTQTYPSLTQTTTSRHSESRFRLLPPWLHGWKTSSRWFQTRKHPKMIWASFFPFPRLGLWSASVPGRRWSFHNIIGINWLFWDQPQEMDDPTC